MEEYGIINLVRDNKHHKNITAEEQIKMQNLISNLNNLLPLEGNEFLLETLIFVGKDKEYKKIMENGDGQYGSMFHKDLIKEIEDKNILDVKNLIEYMIDGLEDEM
jgi:hypothetical protein